MDIASQKGYRKWLTSILWASLTALPVILWMWATWQAKKTGNSAATGYMAHYGQGGIAALFKDAYEFFMQLLTVSFASLINGYAGREEFTRSSQSLIYIIPFLIVPGAIHVIVKRKRVALAILMFFAAFVISQIFKTGSRERYAWPMMWIILLMCCYTLQTLLVFIRNKSSMPPFIEMFFKSTVIIMAVFALYSMAPIHLSFHPDGGLSAKFPYIAALIMIALAIGRGVIYRYRSILTDAALTMLVFAMLISNQFTLVQTLGDGLKDVEFKMLADWYRQNAQPGEKLLTTLPNLVSVFQPKKSHLFVATTKIGGDDLGRFIAGCRKKNITYVAWDSRLGLAWTNSYYKTWRLARIAPLKHARDFGPFEFVEHLRHNPDRFINIYRFRDTELNK